ncbi:MAG: type IV toxin-antitoxin system AbiEi family antitoxin domain-containing protein [Actinomycetota bacterium]
MARQDPRDSRRRLLSTVASQSGYFTAAQAREAGYSYQAQRYHVARGNWVRVERGVYRLPEWPPGPHEDLVRWTLWSGGRGTVSHDTALAVHELGDVMPARIHLTVPPGFARRSQAVILHHAQLPPGDLEEREGYSVTTPLRSILDTAASGIQTDQLARVIEDAIGRGVVTKRVLRSRADEFGSKAALAVERALLQEVG